MATSTPPVTLPSNTWIDIYDATGISVGTQVTIQNTGSNVTLLSESATEPTLTFKQTGFNKVNPDTFLISAETPVGIWAYAKAGSRLQVEES